MRVRQKGAVFAGVCAAPSCLSRRITASSPPLSPPSVPFITEDQRTDPPLFCVCVCVCVQSSGMLRCAIAASHGKADIVGSRWLSCRMLCTRTAVLLPPRKLTMSKRRLMAKQKRSYQAGPSIAICFLLVGMAVVKAGLSLRGRYDDSIYGG